MYRIRKYQKQKIVILAYELCAKEKSLAKLKEAKESEK